MQDKKLYDLTNPQKSIWNMEKFFENTINNICTPAIVYEKLDKKLLEKSINNVVKNNDNFRIHITLENGLPMQYIADYEPFNLDFIYINEKSELREIEMQEVSYNFSMLNSPLFRFKVAVFKNGFFAIVLTVNHIIADSWGLSLVIKNILKEYHSLKNNIDLSKEENTSYLDYIKSEEKYKNSEKYIKDKEYWEDVFRTIPENITFPSSKSIVSSISSCAERKTFELDTDFVKEINSFCKRNNVSVYTFLMSIYSIYISRVSSSNDFVIGTPILNRTSISDKKTIGMFVNMLPVRISVLENQTFINFIHLLNANIMGVLRHQKYSYTQIIEDLREKNSNIASLYNILISYQITKAFDEKYGKYKTDWVFNNHCSSDFNIHIADINDTGKFIINYDYLIDKYSSNDAENIHRNIVHMIKQVLQNDTIFINDVDILSPDKRNKIVNLFNETKRDYPKNKTIVDLFEEQAKKTPNNIAVVFENKKLTYKELNEKSNSLAYYLRNIQGLKRGSLVGILVNRSIEVMVCILGVLKAGGAYVPIDPNYPKNRIEYMLENSHVDVLLTQKELVNQVTFDNKIFIDLTNTSIYEYPCKNLKHVNEPDDLAYVIFTSGSTGVPKGSMQKHQNVVNLRYAIIDFLHFSDKNTIASLATISFDMFVLESIVSLLIGLKIVISNTSEQTSINLFNELCLKHNVDILQTTPSRMQSFMLSANNVDFIKNAKSILIGGEPFPSGLFEKIKEFSNAKIYNMYGPTETTVWSSGKQLLNSKDINIGKPLANTQIYILDSNQKPLPEGAIGEIYISGDGVGLGYLNNELLTKNSFLPNPFIPGEVMYKTGDLGKFTGDGDIVCLGRLDNQVKIRGLRIELGEIEDKISQLDFVKSCAVVKKSSSNSHEFLCAYYTSDITVKENDIRVYLENSLPRYMIPSFFVQIDDFPYTTTGKIDRKKLPDPQIETNNKEIVLPRNDIDSKLIELCKNILNKSSISITDSFFEIGGDSLSAINLCAEIQDKFHVQLFVKDVLDNPIVQDLSDIISKYANTSDSQVIQHLPSSEFYHISFAQKRIYLSSQIAGKNSILYNIAGGVILEGNIDISKLENCFLKLINRHESLRTYFEMVDNQVVQKVSNDVCFKLDLLEGANFSELNNIFKDFVKPFDLSKAPLFRVKFIKFNNNKSAILVDMHHIISDGTSLAILTDELCKLYNNDTLPTLNITYKDFAEFDNNRLSSSSFIESKNYWLSKFEGELPVLNMPTKSQRPTIKSYSGSRVYCSIPADVVQKIDILSRQLNVTPYMILLSIFYILLYKYTSQEDIIIGSPVVGRDIAETYNIIGMFVNTLALRNTINGNMSFRDFLLNVKKCVLDSYKYQTYPFDELVNSLNIQRDSSRNPLFDVMFAYQNNGYKTVSFDKVKSKNYIPDIGISKFDLSIEAIPVNDFIDLSFEYATELFDYEFIKNLSNHYINILNNCLENISEEICDINMLSKDEEYMILHDFNNTKSDYPRDKTISQVFEDQVQKNPNNVAICFDDINLTYIELNEKANKLARYLKSQGVNSKDNVLILADKSIDMYISIMAILKLGAIYVPLDAEYPQERIDLIAEDCNPKIAIVDEKYSCLLKNIKLCTLPLKDLEKYDCTNVENTIAPDNGAYIIYTSGSTGRPKGVLVPNRGVVRLVKNTNYITFENNDRILQNIPIVFDASTFAIFGSLLNGLTMYPISKDNLLDFKYFENYIKNNNINIINMTVSYFNKLIDYNPKIFDNTRVILIGGETVLPRTINILMDVNPNVKIVNVYGPTENSNLSCCYQIDRKFESSVPIGFPVANSTCYILDSNQNLLPVGIPGEICVGGDGVAVGYLNNEKLTNEKFIGNKFADGKLYRTGDLGYWQPDGSIQFISRMDNQVKIRGFRIELKEIESRILEFGNIKECFVNVFNNKNNNMLIAYIVPNKTIDTKELHSFLKEKLPYYMVPSRYISLESLPLTINGKLDTKSLPNVLDLQDDTYVEPQTKLQKQLVDIWEKLLNIKPIGINSNFFELGGDSLLAMSLSVELQKISHNVQYSDIFRYPTIMELEEKINSNNDSLLFAKVENLSDSFVKILDDGRQKEKIQEFHPTNVLLAGSTGFLGIHILEQFIKNETGNIYCIVRAGKNSTPEDRLRQKLNYYFGNKYAALLSKRIFAINGNIIKPNFGLSHSDLSKISNSIDIVINSAANVAHFGNYEDFYNSNVQSVKYMIDFCKTFNKKLYHISTISVIGDGSDLSLLYNKKKKIKHIKLTESKLYVGQILDNVYTRSKFEAERYILDSISTGLDAYIFRMGNLMPRNTDGKFQENALDNAFINRIISFIKIGMVPEYLLKTKLEFSPIDCSAEAIYHIITHPVNKNRIFHLNNPKSISVKKLLKLLKKFNYDVKIVTEKDFKDEINLLLEHDDSQKILNNLIKDFDSNLHLNYTIDIIVKSNYTKKYLKKTGFKWPKISNEYLNRFINLLRKVM